MRWIVFRSALLCALLACTGCGQPTPASISAAASPNPTLTSEAPNTYTVDEDMYAYVHSMQERVAKAKIIVFGTVRQTDQIINMNRDVEDPAKPARDSFSIGQVYAVDVAHYVKGSGPARLNIVNLEGDVPGATPGNVTQAQIDQAKANSRYKSLEIGTSYLFFLDPFNGTDIQGTYYVGGLGYPWRFRVASDGRFVSEGPRGEPALAAGSDFDTRAQDDLFAQIAQLVQAEAQKSSATSSTPSAPSPVSTPAFIAETNTTIIDAIYFHSSEEQVAKAALIVLGTVREQTQVINTSRDVEDPTKPTRDRFSVGQGYTVDVQKYFKGHAEQAIQVLNHEGAADLLGEQDVTPAMIEQIKAASPYAPLEIGQTYVFFLRPYTYPEVEGTLYITSGGIPWRYRDNRNGTFTGEDYNGTPLGGAASTFKQDDLFAQITQLVQAEAQK